MTATHCRLCGGARLAPVHRGVPRLGGTEPSQFDVARCPDCGLLQTTPVPTAEQLRRIYEADSYTWQPPAGLMGAAEAFYRKALVRADQARVLAEACRRARGRRLLDVGCGDGLLVSEARRAGLDACGVDYPGTPRWPECDPAWKRSADLEAFDEPAAAWDVVSFFHVVEHLRDPVSTLRRVRQWLRPGGVLVVQVPNAASIQAGLFGTRWYGLDVPRHLLHFDPATLSRLLATAGFDVERLRHVSWRDNGPLLASSLLLGLDPRIERERGIERSPAASVARRLLYFGVAWGGLPAVLLESALGRGATITAIARKS
jgi:SAM-dependent methyltransferase